jgi:hypothetical protein
MIVDNGEFVDFARSLGRSYKKVYYHNPDWSSFYRSVNECQLGSGFEEIELVPGMMDHFDEVDFYIFLRSMDASIQVLLAGLGKAVWGAKHGIWLEYERDRCKQLMKSLGLPVAPYAALKGLDALAEYLKKHDDQWVKLNGYRAHFESFFAPDYEQVESKFNRMRWEMGENRNDVTFTSENNLPDAFEFAIDSQSIFGQLPNKVLYGVEIKDVGYLARWTDYAAVPDFAKAFDKAIAPTLEEEGYCTFYSPETRKGKEGPAHMIDLTCRLPSPPGECYPTAMKNLPEVMWEGANGNCIDPEPSDEWVAQLMLESEWAASNWTAIDIPKEYEPYLKLKSVERRNGKLYVIPQMVKSSTIGAAIGKGSTMERAINMAREVAKSVSGLQLETNEASLDKAQEQIAFAKECGAWLTSEK